MKKKMDAMDEMFVPYKEMFESPVKKISKSPPLQKDSSSKTWIWIALGVFLILGLFVFFRKYIFQAANVEEVPEKPLVSSPQPLQLSSVSKPSEIVEYENLHLLAKGVGGKLRDMLLKHKQIPALQVAEIVSNTVRILLGENEKPQVVEQKAVHQSMHQSMHQALNPALLQKVVEQPIVKEQRLPEPRLDGPKVKPPEMKDVPEEVEEPRRGKINAETDPTLLKLLKERGMMN